MHNTTLNLQLFAEGGAAAASGGTAAVAGSQEAGGSLAEVKYGIQPEVPKPAQQQETPVDRAAAFEQMIKGEYKDLYDQRVQDTVKRRLRSSEETVKRYEALTPMVDFLAQRYGVKADDRGNIDLDALQKAVQEDETYFEREAMDRGMDVEELKYVKRMERENAELRRQMAQEKSRQQADRLYAAWMEQAQAAKAVYPSLDLSKELQNPKFTELLRSNIDVRTAYEVTHKDEIISGAMQFTAQKVEKDLANKIQANSRRPSENGNGGQGAAVVKSDVAQLTKADRREIIRRVQRGEKISF